MSLQYCVGIQNQRGIHFCLIDDEEVVYDLPRCSVNDGVSGDPTDVSSFS